MKKFVWLILLSIFISAPSFAFERYVGGSKFVQETDKFTMNRPLAAPAKPLSLGTTCTIGVNCDGTSVDIANGGYVMTTAAITITLPEISNSTATTTATQVDVGAQICFFVRDHNEALTVRPHYNDSIRYLATKDTAGQGIVNTVAADAGGGDGICFVAMETDAWFARIGAGTWTAE